MKSPIPARLSAFLASRSLAALAAIYLSPIFPAPTLGAMCDDTYNLQSATQTILTGTNPNSLSKTAKVLKGDLSDLTVLHDLMSYSIVMGFEGSCAKAGKPVRFLTRGATDKGFALRTETYQVVMYDTTTQLAGSRFDYWFGFYKPADTLQIALGRIKGDGPDFRGWYGYVSFEDSVRNPESGIWSNRGIQLRMAGPADSAALDSILMVRTGYRDIAFGENRRGHFKLQFIRVSLENKPGNAIRQRAIAARTPGASPDGDAYLVNGKKITNENVPAPLSAPRYVKTRR